VILAEGSFSQEGFAEGTIRRWRGRRRIILRGFDAPMFSRTTNFPARVRAYVRG